MGVVISYLIKDAMETTIATDVSALKGKVDDVVQVRGGTPILAHTHTHTHTSAGKKVCLKSADCINCDPAQCAHVEKEKPCC